MDVLEIPGSPAGIGQPPLPMLPFDARPIGDAAGVCEDDNGGAVFIWGNAAFTWDASDEGARRFAAVQLLDGDLGVSGTYDAIGGHFA